jgi:hypothetical protein
MNEKSGYVNSTIFMQWLKEHFIPRKPPGKVVLLLDGHTSHWTDPDMLELDQENGILVRLPPHSTHYLQPLDRCFFRPLKHFFYKAMRIWAQSHPGRKVSRAQFAPLLKEAWQKPATQSKPHSRFETCGIYPYNPGKIPEEAFLISDAVLPASADGNNGPHNYQAPDHGSHSGTESSGSSAPLQAGNQPQARTSFEDIAPVPILASLPKQRKKTAALLTDKEHLNQVKMRQQKATGVGQKSYRSNTRTTATGNENDCVVCKVNYYDRNGPQVDWIQCIICMKWLHETCTNATDMCDNCADRNKHHMIQ